MGSTKTVMPAHTALPWHVEGPRIYSSSKGLIATVAHFRDSLEEEANAEFIVRACNEFDARGIAMQTMTAKAERLEGVNADLVKALQRALDDMEDTAHIIDMKATKDAVCRSIAIKANAVRATLIKVGAA